MNGPKILFEIPLFGGIPVTETIVNFWYIMGFILVLSLILTHKMDVRKPTKKQAVAEWIVQAITNLVGEAMGKDKLFFAPFVLTLFLASLLSSLSSLLGLRPPTGDLNTTLGWALMTFVLVQFFGIKRKGVKNHFKGLMDPTPVILPLNIIGELSKPISLSFRHFGNIVAVLVISKFIYDGLGGLSAAVFGLIPGDWTIPIFQIGLPAVLSLYFDLFTSFMQAFIFCMLTMVFISMSMDD